MFRLLTIIASSSLGKVRKMPREGACLKGLEREDGLTDDVGDDLGGSRTGRRASSC